MQFPVPHNDTQTPWLRHKGVENAFIHLNLLPIIDRRLHFPVKRYAIHNALTLALCTNLGNEDLFVCELVVDLPVTDNGGLLLPQLFRFEEIRRISLHAWEKFEIARDRDDIHAVPELDEFERLGGEQKQIYVSYSPVLRKCDVM